MAHVVLACDGTAVAVCVAVLSLWCMVHGAEDCCKRPEFTGPNRTLVCGQECCFGAFIHIGARARTPTGTRLYTRKYGCPAYMHATRTYVHACTDVS